MKIIYLKKNGKVVKNTVFRNYDKNTGEVIFYELIGLNGDGEIKHQLLLNGKKCYRRLFIQRVFPAVPVD